MEFIGRQIDFGIAVEGSRGEAETEPQRWIRKTVANVVPKNERKVDDTSFGRLEDADRVRTVRKWNEGSVDGILHADALGYFLLNLYGAVDSDEIDDDVYEHTFTLDQDIQHPTLSLFMLDAAVRAVAIAGAVVSSLKLSIATDDYLRFSAEFIGKEEEDLDSPPVPEVSAEFDFVGRDVTLKFADTLEALGAATPIKAKSIAVTWNPGVIADYVVGDYSPDDIYNGAFGLEFSFTRNYADQTFETLYKSQDFKYCEIRIEGEALLSDSSSKPLIVLTLNKAQVTNWNRAGAQNELVTEDVDVKAFYNSSDQKQSEVTLVNATASYAAAS